MCERLSELRWAMEDYAADFDAALYSVADCEQLVENAAALEKMAAALKAEAAARVASTGLWRSSGARSPAEHLARRTGTSVGQAADAIATARRLQRLPQARQAARRGALSPAQASAIAEAAGADPAAEHRLVEKASQASLTDLRDECARTRAAADDDAEARRHRIHRGRYLRRYIDGEGAFNLHLRDNPEVGAEMMAVLDRRRDELAAHARGEGRDEPLEAHAADALADVVRAAAAPSDQAGAEPDPDRRRWPFAKVLVRVDLPTLLRGWAIDGEVCELVGYGPVAVSAVREMIESGDPFLAAVATAAVKVLGVAHLGRRPTAHQRSALEWLYPRCANQACSQLARLEIDHRHDWARTHLTLVDWCERLCRHDHDLKTRKGWVLVPGTGRRAFVAPDDPRHPANAGEGERAPPAA